MEKFDEAFGEVQKEKAKAEKKTAIADGRKKQIQRNDSGGASPSGNVDEKRQSRV